MIYVDIKGNLGNQMFEYALARTIQYKTGQSITLNTVWLQKYKPEYIFSLDIFLLNENVFIENDKELPRFMNTYKKGIVRLLKGIFPRTFFYIMSRMGAYIYLKGGYLKLPLNKKFKNYYICGYWQSTKYFEEIKSVLKQEFVFKYDRLEKNDALYEIIEESESICVTVRCGDYMTNEKYKKRFLVCTPEFYEKGVRLIKEVYPSAAVCVFSDDIGWCKKNLNFGEKVYYETGEDPLWEKLRMMSLCKHFVISNSTFSWWAQFLSNNENKIVYAPKPWFPDNRKCDIYEDYWKYIEVK